MIDQSSEYLPANNTHDRRVIPMHAPVPGVEFSYAAALRVRAYQNCFAARAQAREAYSSCDPDGVERCSAEANAYLAAALNWSAFIIDTFRIRSN